MFAFAWATAGLFHQLSFTDWRWYSIKGIILSFAVLLVLSKPSSWQRFAVFLVIDWLSVALASPIHPNHIVFSWIVNGTVLAALLMVGVKNKGISDNDFASKWYSAFAPWVRIELCMLYFFTVFHKLNVSYFDLDWSCAVTMHVEINDRIPLLPDADWAKYASVYGTLIIETAIPLLLIFRRTRVGGVFLGMLFHGLLALHPHQGLFSFSATMAALFTVFLPVTIAEALKPNDRFLKVWRWVLFVLGTLVVLWSFRTLLPPSLHLEDKLAEHWRVGFAAYYLYLATGLTLFIRSLQNKQHRLQFSEGTWRSHMMLIAFPLLLFVNGVGPYIGLRTQTSFSMFSNLHTENGMCNHLIVPSGIQITNWQYDLVEIIDSNDSGLISTRNKGLLEVYLDLRRIRTIAGPDFWVTFRRDGKNETFDMTKAQTYNILPELGGLAKRYFYFRPVERDPTKVKCKH